MLNKNNMFALVLLFIFVFSCTMSSDVYAKNAKKDGYYSTVIQSNKPTYDYEYIKKVKVYKNKIITYGSFCYGNKIWSGKRIKEKKRKFKLSKKCKYIDGYGVPGGYHKISKKEAMSYFKGNLYYPYDSPIRCIIKVKKGKVVKLMFGQS